MLKASVLVLALLFATVLTEAKLNVHHARVGSLKSPGADPAWCPTCVSFMDQSINQLLNIIANAGVLGGCEDLCSLLPTQVEATVCNLVCDVVGIEAFIDLVNDADPDPVWICEEVSICPINDAANATVLSLTVSPLSGPQGTSFNALAVYKVGNTIGTGEVDFVVLPPDGFPFGAGELVVQQTPGSYSVRFGPISTQPSEQEPFSPGVYKVQVAVCEGSCGSSHSHSYTLSTRVAQFTITQ
eukprot:TRINITY_DN358_c0_g1_i1.p1 TRINITY_DN358_c0_g1~~TRINITY_DN358_c0_g1_i1.p1  ORF type:complete len:257 (-),score=32.38 TRINITY_DN358_c0_g1_i1:65-790(-)